MIWTVRFWQDAAERAIKSFAQGILAALGLGVVTPASIPWNTALVGGAFTALLSVLTSVSSIKVSPEGTASLVNTSPTDPESGLITVQQILYLCLLVIAVIVAVVLWRHHVQFSIR